MKCPKCRFENPDGIRFCGNCASPLQLERDTSLSHTKTLETPVGELIRGTLFADRYEIIEELGRGGMGRVFRVEDKKIHEEVALKLIKPEISEDAQTIERFSNELKIARKIRHKNVCGMYDLGEDEGTRFITMEYVPGEDLKSLLRRMGRLDSGSVIKAAKQLCEGLAEAHRLGVIHRDLKPSNIMIDKQGSARIMDFGIARSIEAKGITQTGMMIGTPEYMSPEQAEGQDVDHRSDIYSLGVVLYAMVTGQLPFEGDTPLSIAMKHKSEVPMEPNKLNPQIWESLNRLILRCLEKDTEKRYQSIDQILEDLENIEKEISNSEKGVEKKDFRVTKEVFSSHKLKKILLPIMVSFAVIAVGLIVKQTVRKSEISSPLPKRSSLAVLYFKNNTGDESLDHWRAAFADLLITDLSQSRYIRVLSAERLNKILSEEDQFDAGMYSLEDLKLVAERGRVQKIVVGNFVRAADLFRINLTLQDANTGELIGSESVKGKGEGDFFSMVDELTRRIKMLLEFSKSELAADLDEEVIKITTSSPEAYRDYIEGNAYNRRGDFQKSAASLERAVELDPEFAMAYQSLSVTYMNLGLDNKMKEAHQKALEFSYRVSERERYFIQGSFYRKSERTYDQAIEIYRDFLELYPDDERARANLGWLYLMTEKWEKAVVMFQPLVEENRFESIVSFWNLAEVYMAKGDYTAAELVCLNSLNYYPDNAHTYELLIFIALCKREYGDAWDLMDEAVSLGLEIDQAMIKGDIFLNQGELEKSEQEYLKLPEGSEKRRRRRASLYMLQGRITDAKKILGLGSPIQPPLAYIHRKFGGPDKALQWHQQELAHAVESEKLFEQIQALYCVGLDQVAMSSWGEAQTTANRLLEVIQESPYDLAVKYYHDLKARFEMRRGNYSDAVDYAVKAEPLLSHQRYLRCVEQAPFYETSALAFYAAGDWDNARQFCERIQALTMGRIEYGDIYAKSFYLLAKISEKMSETTKSIEYYKKFLNLWKDADPSLPELEDARNRLGAINERSQGVY